MRRHRVCLLARPMKFRNEVKRKETRYPCARSVRRRAEEEHGRNRQPFLRSQIQPCNLKLGAQAEEVASEVCTVRNAIWPNYWD